MERWTKTKSQRRMSEIQIDFLQLGHISSPPKLLYLWAALGTRGGMPPEEQNLEILNVWNQKSSWELGEAHWEVHPFYILFNNCRQALTLALPFQYTGIQGNDPDLATLDALSFLPLCSQLPITNIIAWLCTDVLQKVSFQPLLPYTICKWALWIFCSISFQRLIGITTLLPWKITPSSRVNGRLQF